MSDLPDAVWVCAAATDEDAAVVGEHDHQVFGVTLEPEPRLLDQADPASQERQVPTVRLRLVEVDRQAPRRRVHVIANPLLWIARAPHPTGLCRGAVPGLLCQGPGRAAGTRAPRGDGIESPPVDQLDVRRVLSVPVQLDGRPVGTLDVPCHQLRPGREELMALGAFATPTAELVRTGVELISRDLEMAQLRQAVISGIWVEQAKAERVAALAIDDARVRAAEARAQAAETHCRRPEPDWPDVPQHWTEPKTTLTLGSGPPTNATTSLTSVTGPPTNASELPARTISRGWRW
jgi:hypothetical protein